MSSLRAASQGAGPAFGASPGVLRASSRHPQKMLTYEPNKRVSAREALKHAYFEDLVSMR